MCAAPHISVGKNPLIDHLGHCLTSDVTLVVAEAGMCDFHKDPGRLGSQTPAACS